jgi:hypothetical protein
MPCECARDACVCFLGLHGWYAGPETTFAVVFDAIGILIDLHALAGPNAGHQPLPPGAPPRCRAATVRDPYFTVRLRASNSAHAAANARAVVAAHGVRPLILPRFYRPGPHEPVPPAQADPIRAHLDRLGWSDELMARFEAAVQAGAAAK